MYFFADDFKHTGLVLNEEQCLFKNCRFLGTISWTATCVGGKTYCYSLGRRGVHIFPDGLKVAFIAGRYEANSLSSPKIMVVDIFVDSALWYLNFHSHYTKTTSSRFGSRPLHCLKGWMFF